MRILIIEDDEPVAEIFADVFRAQGHTIDVQVTGEAGLRALFEARPDAVFLDLKLPNMSGVDVLRAIRAQDPGLPVVVITGRATGQEFEEIARLGITEFIEKPLILQRIRDAIERITPP